MGRYVYLSLHVHPELTGFFSQTAAATFVKSILKPAIPLSPPKQIPPHLSVRKIPTSPQKPSRQTSPQKRNRGPQEGFLIDTSDLSNSVAIPKLALPNPFGGLSPKRGLAPDAAAAQVPNLVAVRTEEEQQQAARQREQQDKDVSARKDARRKSLGTCFQPLLHRTRVSDRIFRSLTLLSKSASLICTRSDVAHMGCR